LLVVSRTLYILLQPTHSATRCGIQPTPLCWPRSSSSCVLSFLRSVVLLCFHYKSNRPTHQLSFPWFVVNVSLPTEGLRGKMDPFLRTIVTSQLKWFTLNALIDFFWWTKLRLSTLIDSFEICSLPHYPTSSVRLLSHLRL
jgi:hypothetical protein